jgi:hypothetical protein
VENIGENRFCCFLCDFSICDKCAEVIDTGDSSNGSVMGSNLTLPKMANKMAKMVDTVGAGSSGDKTRRYPTLIFFVSKIFFDTFIFLK